MAFERTVTLLSGGKLRNIPRREVVLALVASFEPFKIISVQFGYDNILLVFEKPEGKASALGRGAINICGKYIKVEGGAQVMTVVLFDYPFEADEEPVVEALRPFGTYKSFSMQKFPYDDMVMYTGARLIRFVLSRDMFELPRTIMIGGYYCRLWHRGQTIQCNICSKEGHKASECPLKGKCLHCHREGHFSRNCPDKADPFDLVPPADGGKDDSSPSSVDPAPGGGAGENVDLASSEFVANPVSVNPAPSEGEGVSVGSAYSTDVVEPQVGASVPGGEIEESVDRSHNLLSLNSSADTLENCSQVSQIVASQDSCDVPLDTRDNELNELDSQVSSVTSVLRVTLSPPRGEVSHTSVTPDSEMEEPNLRKRSLPSDSNESEGGDDVSLGLAPASRRPKIRPVVNVSNARSRPRDGLPGSLC